MTDTEETGIIPVVSSGDLRVHIMREDDNTPLKGFVVSSGALRLASPVWSTMLDPQGHFTESHGGEMSLTDDDPTAFLILMRVAHMQFNQIEAAISYKTLLALAKICDKYDMVTLIRPWVDQWLKPYASQAADESYMGFEGLAFIAWTLGEPELFWKVAQHLVANVTFDVNGNMMHQGKIVDSTWPPGLHETIKAFRDEKITRMAALCMPTINQYTAFAGARHRHCIDGRSCQSAEGLECDSLNIGNLVLQSKELGLWPDQSHARTNKSLNSLRSGLLAIPEMSLSSAHECCGFYHSLKPDVRRIADLRLPTKRLRECEEHMAMQKAK